MFDKELYSKKWRKKNKEWLFEYRKKYYKENRKQILEYQKSRYGRNRERLMKCAKIRYRKKRKCIHQRAITICYSAKKSAENKKLDFNVTVDWIEEKLRLGVCEFSGLKFKYNGTAKFRNPYSPSIDRKNPKKGYTKRNCQIVLWGVNMAKGQMSLREYEGFLKKIYFGNIERR